MKVQTLAGERLLCDKQKNCNIAVISSCAVMNIGLSQFLSGIAGADETFIFKGCDEIDEGILNKYQISVVIIDAQECESQKKVCAGISRLSKVEPISILVFSSGRDLGLITEYIRSGARSHISRNAPISFLAEAVNTLKKGQCWFEPHVNEYYRGQCKSGSSLLLTVEEKFNLILSPAEQSVIIHLISGMTVTEIAHHKRRSVKTISGQKQTAMKKLGVKSHRELLNEYGHLSVH